MGSGISENYDQITPIFTSGFWKVHSAVHKQTQIRVSLWLFDRKSARSAGRQSSDFERYIFCVTQSLAQMRRLHHPNVLKVTEISESPDDLCFAAEEIDKTLEVDTSLTADDVVYIADQVIQTIQFVHTNAGLMHLTISPHTIALTKALQVKLCDFTFSVSVTQGYKYPEYEVSPLWPGLHYSAPEILLNENVSISSDVFSWAAVLAFCFKHDLFFDSANVDDQMRQIQGRSIPDIANGELRELIVRSLHIDASCRPSVDEIVKSKAFLQLSIRSLRFLDNIFVQSKRDRIQFYGRLIPTLTVFSDRLLDHKLYPLFVGELLSDDGYGPALIPIIFRIGRRYDKPAFMRKVIEPLQHILRRTDPEELAFANLAVTPIIIDRVDVDRQSDVLYPLFIACLQSRSTRLRGEVLKHIPGMIASMSEQVILASLLPTLLGFLHDVDDTSVCCSVVECLGQCLAKVHPDAFCEHVVPKMLICWQRIELPQLAAAIEFVLRKVRPSSAYVCKYVVPIAAEILASRRADAATDNALAVVITQSMDVILSDRNLIARSASWQPEDAMDPPRIAAPVRVAALDLLQRRRGASDVEHQSKNVVEGGRARNGSDTVATQKPRRSVPTDVAPPRPAQAGQPDLFSGMSMGGPRKRELPPGNLS
jgi:SCY1-like protein 2